MSQTINRKDAIRELWYRGILTYKLHPVQQKMLNSYITANQEITIIACARRLGKSYLLCLLAIEQCLKKPNAIVKYVCPRKDQVKTIMQPIMNTILADCPPELKPEYKYNEKLYRFPNGSQIQMAGTDNGHHETLRGGMSDLWIVDEAGFCDELKYVVNSVLAPTSDTTGGRGVIASTPAPTADHEFNTEFFRPAEDRGDLIKYTIYDNPMLSKAKIEEITARFKKGADDPEFKREYLCEVSIDADKLIVPEFEAVQKNVIRDNYPRPPFYDSYVSMDVGVKDLTVVLFGYYDFRSAKLIIENEYVTSGKEFRTDRLAKDVRKKEEETFTHPLTKEFKEPYLRVSDNNNLVLLNDLSFTFNMHFNPTRKDNKEAAINDLRVMMAEERIIVHPRCQTLIKHLRNGSWDKSRKEFARSPDMGHYDAVDALIYLVRNLQTNKNPYPPGYNIGTSDRFYPNGYKKPGGDNTQVWIDMFKVRKGGRPQS